MRIPNIADRLTKFREMLAPPLREKGYRVLGSDNREQFPESRLLRLKHRNILELHQKLDTGGIVISLRDGLSGEKCIRVAPHFYNTEKEIELVPG